MGRAEDAAVVPGGSAGSTWLRDSGKGVVVGSSVVVYGAYGHTAGFVVADLRERGFVPVLSGRDISRLRTLAAAHPGTEVRPAALDSPIALDRVLHGVSAVVNCAGPFGDTPPPLLDAALQACVPYLDVAGEALVVLRTFSLHDDAGGPVVIPTVGFFGALGDLLATAAFGDWPDADEVTVAIALDSWTPTQGSRRAGELRAGRRVVFTEGRLTVQAGDSVPPSATWDFPPPFGTREVVGEFPTADVVTIARHLPTRDIRAYLHGGDGPTAPGVDERGRSAQQFIVEVAVRRNGEERRAVARGRDIYAISATIAGEAVERLLDGRSRAVGVTTAGQAFDAVDFLRALPLELSGTGGPEGERYAS